MTVTQEELATKLDSIDWFTLRAHLERDVIIVIDPILDLAEVGAGVANDDVKTIERWLLSGLMGKPSAQQIESWDADKKKAFLCLIIAPYVLIQEESPEKG
jgi:hypothetical protein